MKHMYLYGTTSEAQTNAIDAIFGVVPELVIPLTPFQDLGSQVGVSASEECRFACLMRSEFVMLSMCVILW